MSAQRDIYIFLGPPGSGKGSLSQLCVKRLGWQQLSTGNLCREHIARQTDIGRAIDFAISQGKLISDDLVVSMVEEWLDRTLAEAQTVILDGFPRTLAQAQALHELTEQLNDVRLNLVRLELTDEEVMYRLLARSICQNNACQRVYSLHKLSLLQPLKPMICNECESPLMRRSDDEEAAIYERLKIYHEHEQAMLDFYTQVGHKVRTVRADTPLEEVYSKLLDLAGFATV